MTNKNQPDVDEVAERLDSLLVAGLTAIRSGKPDEALMVLQEALKTANRLPKKDEPK